MTHSNHSAAENRVCIIGGGLSGLATAASLNLTRPELGLTLYEASERVGGVIDTSVAGQFVIDHGADMFATQPSHAIDFFQALGIADDLIQPKPDGRGAMIVFRGRLVPIPDGFVLMRATKLWSMVTTPLLSPAGKLRLLAERFVANKAGDADQSVGTFVRQRMGSEVLDRIVGPLVAGIYTADVEKLSMQATMQPIYRMFSEHGSLAAATLSRKRSGSDTLERGSKGARYSQFRAFPGGMCQLIDRVAETLPGETIKLSQPVQSVTRAGSKWQVQTPSGIAEFEHVVVATPAAASARLLQSIAPTAAAELAAIESASTAIVVLAVRRSDIKRPVTTFGFVVPPRENRRIIAGSFASEKFAGRAPEDHVIARCFVGGSLQPELLKLSDEELVSLVREELADLIGLTGQPVESHVVRWNNAMPQYHVGHLVRVQRIKDSVAQVDGLTLTGNALDGVGIAPLVGSAVEAAESVLASLDSDGSAK